MFAFEQFNVVSDMPLACGRTRTKPEQPLHIQPLRITGRLSLLETNVVLGIKALGERSVMRRMNALHRTKARRKMQVRRLT